jgi:cardiolipin synthase
MVGREVAARTAAMLQEDFAGCRRVDAGDYYRRPFWFKLAVRTSRLMAPIQ